MFKWFSTIFSLGAPVSSVVVNIASSVQKVSYSKPLHNKSRCLNTMKSFLPSKSSALGYSCIFKKVSEALIYYETLAKHSVHERDFVMLYIHRLER